MLTTQGGTKDRSAHKELKEPGGYAALIMLRYVAKSDSGLLRAQERKEATLVDAQSGVLLSRQQFASASR